jgi:hypothetical protein
VVIREFLNEVSPEDIVHGRQTLQLADVYAVIAYYLRRREAVDGYLRTRRKKLEDFEALVREWKATRGHTSSAARMAKHPAYQNIMAMGEAAIPLILSELRKEPDHWFLALHALTGADPVPAESRGKLAEMAKAWLEWGGFYGYIQYIQ